MNGCATISSIEDSYVKVNYSDGINKEEAKAIAQKHCLDTDDCRKNFSISSVSVHYVPPKEAKPRRYDSLFKRYFPAEEANPEMWYVSFETKNLFKANRGWFSYNIQLDYKTGEIIDEYIAK